MTDPTAFSRADALRRMASEMFDVVVVGGGVTGAGVALDAAARGLSTALVERGDWASGTSSKSSKLIHGGLRYLQQNEYLLVAENLAERQRLLVNAPHLVTPLPFLIPLFGRDGAVNKTLAKAYSTALWTYDLAGGLRIGHRHRRISSEEAGRLLPTLRRDRMVAAFIYWDARADDARLTLSLARTACLDHGAVAANYAPVAEVLHDDRGKANGVRLAPSPAGARPDAAGTVIRARSVVNAGGVWADAVEELDSRLHPDTIRPAKGVHITVPGSRLPAGAAAVLPVPGDRRSVFVVPWGDRTYIGTTDTDYAGPLDDPQCTAEDVDYLIRAVNAAVDEPIDESDVVGTWAGLRPLIRSAATERTADLSRRHKVTTSASGLVSVTGGKLTTYRKMADDTVDAVIRVLHEQRSLRRCRTRRLPLHGAAGTAELRAPGAEARAGVPSATLEHLVSRYGGEASRVAALATSSPRLGEPLVPGLPYLAAEAVWSARHEMACTLDDILSRRTRALLLDRDATAAAAPAVADLIGPELGWDEAERQRQAAAFVAGADRERAAARAGS